MTKAYSIVRHYPLLASVKAAEMLNYFSQITSTQLHLVEHSLLDLMHGVTYFSGFMPLTLTSHQISPPISQEIIALCPKWLLSAHTDPTHPHSSRICITQTRRATTGKQRTTQQGTANDFFKQLQDLTVDHNSEYKKQPDEASASNAFTGGIAGFIGYDLVTHAHSVSFAHPTAIHSQREPDAIQPSSLIAAIGEYDIFLKHEETEWALYGSDDPELIPLYDMISHYLHLLKNCLLSGKELPSSKLQISQPFTPIWSEQDYAEAFTHIQSYLQAGDCYQVNLTQPFIAKADGYLLAALEDLKTLTQAPYAGYMRVGEHELLCCSPELFLAFTGNDDQHNNMVITRPIKGTYPRHTDVYIDEKNKHWLDTSEKDRSENLMIVDLLRNDLSKHAIVGSVTVPELFTIESFAQVHHLVSEIRATLPPEVSALDVLIDALPGGSITGAPKKRAMEIITELEARPRGAYCGSFGYLNYDGSGLFNILIRTLQKNDDELVAWAGGGITIASKLDAEYQECWDKIAAILDCVNHFGMK